MNRAVFWIAGRQRYVKEATGSSQSVSRHCQADRWLFCERANPTEAEFTSVVRLQESPHEHWCLAAMGHLVDEVLPTLHNYHQLLWLDSDTYACGDLADIWLLLEKFDFAAAHAPGRQTQEPLSRVPDSFPEFNIGVIAFRNNAATGKLWREVYARYKQNAAHYKNNDQAPLREALWANRDLRITTLAPEWNCRFPFGCFVRGQVRILHGRPPDRDYEAVADSINAEQGLRVWKGGKWLTS